METSGRRYSSTRAQTSPVTTTLSRQAAAALSLAALARGWYSRVLRSTPRSTALLTSSAKIGRKSETCSQRRSHLETSMLHAERDPKENGSPDDAPRGDAQHDEKRRLDPKDPFVPEHVDEPLQGVHEIFAERIARFIHDLAAFARR